MSSIDYDLRKIRAVVMDVDGVLSPQTVAIDADGEPLRATNVHDGFIIGYITKRDLLHLGIITGARTDRVRARYSRLGIRDIYMNVSDKLPLLKRWMEERNFTSEEVAYIGDDVPDIECMQYVGLSCCPKDATPFVKSIARWTSSYNGGEGCVRQLLEEILLAQNRSLLAGASSNKYY